MIYGSVCSGIEAPGAETALRERDSARELLRELRPLCRAAWVLYGMTAARQAVELIDDALKDNG